MAAVRVQSVAGGGLEVIPPQFIRPLHERPIDADTSHGDVVQGSIPVIDLSALQLPEHRSQTVKEIGRACEEWGIFQVINHGVSDSLMERLQTVGKQFFDLPQEEKEEYANNPENGVLEGYGTKLAHNVDGKLEWVDYYFHMLWPPSQRNLRYWPKQPSSYREVTDEYGRALLEVVNNLLSVLSLNLGVEERALRNELGNDNLEMEMKINYYPPCPQPELALGVEPHTDMSALTVLVPNEVPGLQVCKDGNWFTAHYVPNALVIHIGDQLQILSNGKYKSVLHRSSVSKDKVRMSWPVFCTPPGDAVIGPLKQLINDTNPPLFNPKTYREYKHLKINKLGP